MGRENQEEERAQTEVGGEEEIESEGEEENADLQPPNLHVNQDQEVDENFEEDILEENLEDEPHLELEDGENDGEFFDHYYPERYKFEPSEPFYWPEVDTLMLTITMKVGNQLVAIKNPFNPNSCRLSSKRISFTEFSTVIPNFDRTHYSFLVVKNGSGDKSAKEGQKRYSIHLIDPSTFENEFIIPDYFLSRFHLHQGYSDRAEFQFIEENTLMITQKTGSAIFRLVKGEEPILIDNEYHKYKAEFETPKVFKFNEAVSWNHFDRCYVAKINKNSEEGDRLEKVTRIRPEEYSRIFSSSQITKNGRILTQELSIDFSQLQNKNYLLSSILRPPREATGLKPVLVMLELDSVNFGVVRSNEFPIQHGGFQEFKNFFVEMKKDLMIINTSKIFLAFRIATRNEIEPKKRVLSFEILKWKIPRSWEDSSNSIIRKDKNKLILKNTKSVKEFDSENGLIQELVDPPHLQFWGSYSKFRYTIAIDLCFFSLAKISELTKDGIVYSLSGLNNRGKKFEYILEFDLNLNLKRLVQVNRRGGPQD